MVSLLQCIGALGLFTLVIGAPCDQPICQHGGVCHVRNTSSSGLTCFCINGYSGDTCDQHTHCDPKPCGDNGICIKAYTHPYFRCHCHTGYTGSTCQYIDGCASSPCAHGSVCHRVGNSHTCSTTQVSNTGECASSSCPHGSVCHNLGTSHYCSPTQLTNTDACSSHPCQNLGTCTNVGDTFHCRCRPGFSGDTCEVNHVCSAYKPCHNHGTCTETSRSPYYKCTCATGYYGITCNYIDYCRDLPCPPGYHCLDSAHSQRGYKCVCQHPPCADTCDHNPCLNNGHCTTTDTEPLYKCTCPTGYSGDRCEKDACDPDPCHHGSCRRSSAGTTHMCRCDAGYHGYTCSTPSCTASTCRNNGVCQPQTHYPYYQCKCPSGFKGTHCESIDHCVENPCPSPLTCVPTTHDRPGYQCECIHSCIAHGCSPDPCGDGGICGVTNEGYTCLCKIGYSGTQCRVNACDPNPCQHGRCTRRAHTSIPPFACTCDSGYHGLRCESQSCPANTCKNGGTCRPSSRHPYYYCTCPVGYTGTRCESIDHCVSNPCPDGLRCDHATHTVAGYQCQHTHFTNNYCSPNPCGNGAQCVPLSQSPHYHCACTTGYQGPQCRADVCEPNPCTHGQCNHKVSSHVSPLSYMCSCIYGYHGTRCQTPSCTSRSCYHGGKCTPITQSPYFRCTCPYGYSGTQCQTVVPTTRKTTTTTTTTPKPTPKPTTKATTTTQKPTTSSTTVGTTHAPTHGPYCLTCSEVISPDTCEYVSLCGLHEECYVDQHVTSFGSVRYNLGCRDSNQCRAKKRDAHVTSSDHVVNDEAEDGSTDILTCSTCCDKHLCNSGGCGSVGFPPVDQRGSICFHCDQQTMPHTCEKIKLCGRDQYCSVQIYDVGTSNRTVWTSGCQARSECLHEQSNIGDTVDAAEPSRRRYISSYQNDGKCKMSCCHSDLCNRVCRDSTHTG